MRNFSSFVSWSLTFIISLYILRTFGEPASMNLGQPEKLPEDHEGEDYNNVESDRPAPDSLLHYFIFGGEPESAPHKEGHSENDKDKADESCTKNETKIDPKVDEEDDETNVESVDPIEPLNVKVARQAVAPPPPSEGQQNQQNRTNNNIKGPSYTVENYGGNGAKPQIGNNNNNNQQEDQLPKSKNPLDAILEISDPSMRNTMTAFYGSIIGDADCGKKSTCLLGNAVEGFPGRDYFFMFAGRYVPSEWSVLYDIFRISSLYGQNCELYLCQPQQKH